MLPPFLPGETSEQYRLRNNLPHVYIPFFQGDQQVQWQLDIQNKYPIVQFYPYEGMQVSLGLQTVYVAFADASQITEDARKYIQRFCSDYGPEVARRAVPSLLSLKNMYQVALTLV